MQNINNKYHLHRMVGLPTSVPSSGDVPKTENKQYNTNKNMNKNQIRLTESDLKQIVKESIYRVLNENNNINELGIFAKGLNKLSDAISNVRQHELGELSYKCQEHPEIYGTIKQRLDKINVLLMKAIKLATVY